MTTKMTRFTQRAQDNPQRQYTALMGMLFDPEGLNASFERQATNKAPGVDGLRKADYAEGLSIRLADLSERLLPSYAQESQPRRKYLNRDFKTALRIGAVSTDKISLLEKARAFMQGLRQMPHKVASYFRHPAARYAMSDI